MIDKYYLTYFRGAKDVHLLLHLKPAILRFFACESGITVREAEWVVKQGMRGRFTGNPSCYVISNQYIAEYNQHWVEYIAHSFSYIPSEKRFLHGGYGRYISYGSPTIRLPLRYRDRFHKEFLKQIVLNKLTK